MTASRRCAFSVIRRVFEDGAYADRAFRSEAERLGLEGRDRAFAMRLAYGTIQRKLTLDHLIESFTGRDTDALDAPVVAALRLGLYQVVFMERVPDHAAVGESVELAKAARTRGLGLVNATLRRATREARAIVAALGDSTPEEASLRHSHPRWIAELWWDALGPDAARALMAYDNEPAESAVRANTLKTDREALVEALTVPTGVDQAIPEAVVLGEPFDLHGSDLFERGELMPQSRASMLVGRVLDPQPGERVLDLCAAPGAKTTHLAALMGDDGEIVAIEQRQERARAIEENCARLGVTCARIEVGDAAVASFDATFDRVLVDPPCSDLGTLQSRPDVRWRKSPEQIAGLGEVQRRVLDAGAAALRPGGTLVYSTCTISPAENERRVEAFLSGHPDLEALDLSSRYPALASANCRRFLQTLPNRDKTDGFFIVAMKRDSANA